MSSDDFRVLVDRDRPVPALGVFDALSATLASKRFDTIFLSGYGFSASHYGLSDVGFITWTDMVDYTSRIRAILPKTFIIVDIDEGYGDPSIASHVVRRLEQAGASAIIMEDQRRPKRCGHLPGKEIIPIDEYLNRLDSVLRTRTSMFVIARTDASSLSEGIQRARSFVDAGADAVMVEGLPSLQAVASVRQALGPSTPLVVNLIAGGKTPACTLQRLGQLGASIVIYSTPCLFKAHEAIDRYLAFLQANDMKLDLEQSGVPFYESKDLMEMTTLSSCNRNVNQKVFSNNRLQSFAPPNAPPGPIVSQQTGHDGIAHCLYELGVRFAFGVVGVPITQLAHSMQNIGIRFIAFRNEQAAGYAACGMAYLSGTPGVLVTVGGPGVVHGIAGLAHASTNQFPLIMLASSCPTDQLGYGGFQELDQLAATREFSKSSVRMTVDSLFSCVVNAYANATYGRPGGVFVDIPSDVLHATVSVSAPQVHMSVIAELERSDDEKDAMHLLEILRKAEKPLLVFGHHASFHRLEDDISKLVCEARIPCVCTSMGRGLVPSDLDFTRARGFAFRKCDVALVIGADLDWTLHFGTPPHWNPDCRIVLSGANKTKKVTKNVTYMEISPAAALACMSRLITGEFKIETWITQLLAVKTRTINAVNSEQSRAGSRENPSSLGFQEALVCVDKVLVQMDTIPTIVCEGANTMDRCREIISIRKPRGYLDAGTWGTMGVGIGYAIAAALVAPNSVVVAIEGDSAFGFSAMEIETLCRYSLHVVIIVFNNGGVYGKDRRSLSSLKKCALSDPAPTDLIAADYHHMMVCFGGRGFNVTSVEELEKALSHAVETDRPSLINVAIDRDDGVENGTMS